MTRIIENSTGERGDERPYNSKLMVGGSRLWLAVVGWEGREQNVSIESEQVKGEREARKALLQMRLLFFIQLFLFR